MSDTDPKDETSPSTETHDTSSSSSTSSQADTPSHTESGPSQESQSQTESQTEAQLEDTESTADTPSIPSTSPTTPDLEKARAFLRDPEVRKQTAARKATYLTQKGYSQEDIDVMLQSDEDEAKKEHKEQQEQQEQTEHKPAATLPPIVTYPEFVANSSPQPPPPLVTPQVLAAALYGTAATTSLLYTAARLVLAPMVDALNDARSELQETAGIKLTALNEKLEGVVSVVPQTSKPEIAKVVVEPEEIDDDSSYDDPAEVFHRDIGVQTSLPPSPVLPAVTMDSTVPNLATGLSPADTKPSTPSQIQADRVAALADSVRALSQGWVGSADVHADLKATVGVFRDDVDKLSRPPAFTYGGGGGMYNYGGAASTSGSKYPGYVTTTRNEPDDEIRKAKENIRRVKGALLSTRTFPTAR